MISEPALTFLLDQNNDYNTIYYLFVIMRQFPHTENVVCTGNCPNVATRVPPTANTTQHTRHRLRGKSHQTRAQFLHQIKRTQLWKKSHKLILSFSDNLLYTITSQQSLERLCAILKIPVLEITQFLTWFLYVSVRITKSKLKIAI